MNWKAPALNTVLYRFSEGEVKDILTYGRPGTPMAAWGVEGGGPLSNQQLDNVIDYLWSVQISHDEMHEQVDDAVEAIDPELSEPDASRSAKSNDGDPTVARRTPNRSVAPRPRSALGEILFNNPEPPRAAYTCARCHVPGASYGKPWESIDEISRAATARTSWASRTT